MKHRLLGTEHDPVLARPQGQPFGWPAASLTPTPGVGPKQRAEAQLHESSKTRSLRFEGIATGGCYAGALRRPSFTAFAGDMTLDCTLARA